MPVDHGSDLARQLRDLKRRMTVVETGIASADLRPAADANHTLIKTLAQAVADLSAAVHAAGAFPIGVPGAPAIPPPPGPREIAAYGTGSSTLSGPTRSVPVRGGFQVPAGSHSVSIIGWLAVQTLAWQTSTDASAWLELSGLLASGTVRTANDPYLSVVTANLRIDTTLAAGQYEARWLQNLERGNNVRIKGGEIHIWLNN